MGLIFKEGILQNTQKFEISKPAVCKVQEKSSIGTWTFLEILAKQALFNYKTAMPEILNTVIQAAFLSALSNVLAQLITAYQEKVQYLISTLSRSVC